jgi:hypothetical protein
MIKTYYYNTSGIKKNYSNYNITPEKHYSIITKCAKLDNNSEELLTST